MERSGYTGDGQYDWILKKEGNTAQIQRLQMQEERKAPIPRAAAAQAQVGSAGNLAAAARGSSKNLQDM